MYVLKESWSDGQKVSERKFFQYLAIFVSLYPHNLIHYCKLHHKKEAVIFAILHRTLKAKPVDIVCSVD